MKPLSTWIVALAATRDSHYYGRDKFTADHVKRVLRVKRKIQTRNRAEGTQPLTRERQHRSASRSVVSHNKCPFSRQISPPKGVTFD